MKVYTCYSGSHSKMTFDYMLPTLSRRFEVLLHRVPQVCETGVYRTTGWPRAMREKIAMVKEACASEREVFVYSDVDVVFDGFEPEDVASEMDGVDVACANDGGEGVYCAGFMFVRPGVAALRLFDETLSRIEALGCDEPAFNEAVKSVEVHAKLLPVERYSNYGHIAGGGLDGAARLANLPPTVKVFHANYVVGVEEKERILAAALEAFAKRRLPGGGEERKG